MGNLNYKITNLRVDKETMDLINQISSDLGVRNSEVTRLLLKKVSKEIINEGLENFELVIAGKRRSMTKQA
ncbi:hypothetical protein CL621_01885 [archaeon]|nr:hypothetical protein [archaeon]MAG61338.1 hypothetical protein [Candidatus Pacearchaeota archaeon]|tara:strand:+ start:1639 stop:1851 length:213 start_codon:yes stop_codon:yes gene_type:complete